MMRSVFAITCLVHGAFAQLKVANNTRLFQYLASAAGPYDLFHTYPFYYANNVPTTNEYTACSHSNIVFKSSQAAQTPVLKGTIPVYNIYYGADIGSNQKSLLNNLVSTMGSHRMWNVMTQYKAGKPSLGGTFSVSCSKTCNSVYANCFPCDLNQWQEDTILEMLFKRFSSLPRSFNAVYNIVYGSDITYKANGFIMGKSQVCATHGQAHQSSTTGYRYVSTVWPPADSPCNYLSQMQSTPNGAQIDSALGIVFHELVEAIAPPFDDQCNNEIADKCANRVLNVGTVSGCGNGNVKLGSSCYLLPPLWDHQKRYCSMG